MKLKELEELLLIPENDYLDFKKTIYRKETHSDLLVDVMAMANSAYEGDCYIIMGVKQFADGSIDIVGIEESQKVDSSTFQQLIFENIEPVISIELHYINYDGHTLAVMKIKDSLEQPYMMKKKYLKLHEGTCYVRRGSGQGHALRQDFMRFASIKERFEISITDSYLRALDDRRDYASLECSIRNYTSLPVTLIRGELEVLESGELLTRLPLFGFEETVIGTDFRMEIPSMSEKFGDFQFGFTSNDAVRLGLDEYGSREDGISLKLRLMDSSRNIYFASLDSTIILVRGRFLWKVRLKN